MRDKADRSATLPRRGRARDFASYALIAGAVVLGWQMAIQPLMQRAPVEAAIRIAPASPLVLRRAAEAELVAGRNDNAAALGRDALVRAPFDVRALRVVGLTEARAGRETRADDILTLAGNWSLRDGPAHAWLIDHRLRSGDYASAFAHADTLVRRRQDVRPEVFHLFTVAGTQDPEGSLPVIASLLAADPPWRLAYLGSLDETPQELQLAANLAILLEASRTPLTNSELQGLYRVLLVKQQFQALGTVRERLNRPSPGEAVTNGGFGQADAPEPFQWRLFQKAGIGAEIAADDLRVSNPALRIDYDGYAAGTIVEQLTTLSPGSYGLTAEVRSEAGDPAARLAWTLTCVTDGGAIASVPAGARDAPRNRWTRLSGQFQVPADCPAQWLRLVTRADDRRSPTLVWYDRVTISPVG